MDALRTGSVICAGLALTGCVQVPSLPVDGVSVSEIVQRVKCELAVAMPEAQPPYPTGSYQWMQDWTAKVDLTLLTNDQSAITPNASFIHPMTPVTLPVLGTFSRSFTLGVGGGLTTTAVRNETMSFTVSIRELRNEKYRGKCNLPDGLNLYGHLGLQEWIRSALAPVDNNELTIGFHAAPGAKSAGAPRISLEGDDKKAIILTAADDAQKYAIKATASAKRAAFYATKYKVDDRSAGPQVLKNDIQSSFDAARISNGEADRAIVQARRASTTFDKLESTDPLKKDLEVLAAVQKASDAIKQATAAKKSVTATVKLWPQDPPIDSIGHQVQFIVMATGNVTPNWSLVHFKGPGASGTFASATGTQTNTLNIALGAPNGSVNASVEQIRQLDNLKLDSLRLLSNQ